jgi:hypothetical protein
MILEGLRGGVQGFLLCYTCSYRTASGIRNQPASVPAASVKVEEMEPGV